jgi:hypothetical protein
VIQTFLCHLVIVNLKIMPFLMKRSLIFFELPKNKPDEYLLPNIKHNLIVKENTMSKHSWIPVFVVQGELQAEVLRGLLEAQGIPVNLSQEGVARAYGLGVGPLSEVEIRVPENFVQEAEEVIERYQAGDFENMGDQLEDNGEPI